MMTREGVILVLSCLLLISLVAGFQYTLTTQTDFDQGTYNNTLYNSTNLSLQLSPGNTSGTYTSAVFDGLDTSQWNTLTLTSVLPIEPLLLSVDGDDDVWTSHDGIHWVLLIDNYNNGDGGSDADFAFGDYQNYFYSVEDDDDVWRSTTRGLTWSKVNDDYNSEGQHVVRAVSDYNNNLYIIEDDEDVWKSTDSGLNWSKVNGSDFNGGNGDPAGFVVNSSNTLLVVDNSEDVWASTDGIAWYFVANDFNGGEGSDVDYLVIDGQDYLYAIEDDDDIWQSTTSGFTWTKIRTDYNGEGQHVTRATIDSFANFYIIESDEDVWKSTDGGLNWSKVNGSDFNNGNGDVVGLFSINSTTNISAQARSCTLSDCSDTSFSATEASLSLTSNRYFQFHLTLTADATDLTPTVSQVTLDYVDVGIPSVTSVTPQSANFTTNDSISLNATITDGRSLDIVLANITLPNGTSTLVQLFNTSDTFYVTDYTTSLTGEYQFTLLVNDTSNNLNDTETGSFSLSAPDVDTPLITLGSCTPNPSTVGEEVTCTATITDNIQVATVLANITLPDTTVLEPTLSNISELYQFTVNISLVGTASVFWFANDTTGNEQSDGSQQFTVEAANQSSGSGSQSGGGSGSSLPPGNSGLGALRNAPPGTSIINKQPQPNQPSSQTPESSRRQGQTIVQPPRSTETNGVTGAAIGASSGSSTFKKITATFLILALLFFVISYILRERRVATKHLYMKKLRRKIMVKDPQLLDKLQGYVSAEVLSKLKKGDNLQQKRVDPKDKEFAHQFPETAKEIQEKNIQVHPKKFNYERLEQAKKDIFKENKSISATDMRKIFPETLGKTAHLQQENFSFTPRTKEIKEKVGEEDFTRYYDIKETKKAAPVEQKQAPQTSRKINKTSKDGVLKGLQEVYKIE